jgi:quinol monooxygenase YgiN
VLLVCRFIVPDADAPGFLAHARRALQLLTAQPGCRGGELGRSPDDPQRWVLLARFDSVVAYRRALAPFDVREHVVPLLSDAVTGEPATFEVLLDAAHGRVAEHASLLDDPHDLGH